MSNRNPDSSYSQLPAVLDFWGEQLLKSQVNTALPAHIVEYDSTTRRATVDPAITVMLTDGTEQKRPPIVNVPVVHPSGGGYVVHVPLRKGDAVMLLFSQRGLQRFKDAYKQSQPDSDSIMSMADAIAFPGFGSLRMTPATDGLTVQTETGTNYVSIKPGDVRMVSDGNITLTASGVITLQSGGDVLVVQ